MKTIDFTAGINNCMYEHLHLVWLGVSSKCLKFVFVQTKFLETVCKCEHWVTSLLSFSLQFLEISFLLFFKIYHWTEVSGSFKYLHKAEMSICNEICAIYTLT